MTTVSIDVSSVPIKPAGAGRYIVEVVSRLARHDGLHLVVVARRNDGPRWRDLAPEAQVLPAAPAQRPFRLVWEQTRLPKLLTRNNVDVHFAPHYTMPERATVPTVVTVHDMTFFDHPEWHERTKVRVFRRAIKVAATRADKVVAVSDDTARRLKERFPTSDPVVIPLGVDLDRYGLDGRDDAEILGKYAIDGRYVAFVGTIEPRKDTPTLVRAFDRVAEADPDLRLVVVGGDGWGVNAFQDAVDNARHGDRIVRPGYIEEEAIPALLRQAQMVVYPSLAEGFGLPALEALACGAPLITTRDTPMEDFVEDAAVLVSAGDVEALTSAMKQVLDDEDLRSELRRRGPEIAKRFTWDATAEAHASLFATFG